MIKLPDQNSTHKINKIKVGIINPFKNKIISEKGYF